MILVAALIALLFGVLVGLLIVHAAVRWTEMAAEADGSDRDAVDPAVSGTAPERLMVLWAAVVLVASGVALIAVDLRFPGEVVMAMGFILALHSTAREVLARLRPDPGHTSPKDS